MDDLSKRYHNAYKEVWGTSDYRVICVGDYYVDKFLAIANHLPNDGGGNTIIDYGCGTGRYIPKLQKAGFDVLAVDIVDCPLDQDVQVPFRQGSLWDHNFTNTLPSSKYSWSTDMMEHIPPSKVQDVLTFIARNTTYASFFNITLIPSVRDFVFDDGTIENVHCTVREADWWTVRLKRLYRDVASLHRSDDSVTYLAFKDTVPDEIKMIVSEQLKQFYIQE